jgi:hypothetical protein
MRLDFAVATRVVEMNALERYLALIVEPTVEEFRCNPFSLRHAYLACVATYHAIDRVAYPQGVGQGVHGIPHH